MLDFSMYQSGIDFKCPYSNRPTHPHGVRVRERSQRHTQQRVVARRSVCEPRRLLGQPVWHPVDE